MNNEETGKALAEQKYAVKLLDRISAVHEATTYLTKNERHSLHQPHLDNGLLMMIRLKALISEFTLMDCSVPRRYREYLPDGAQSDADDFFDYAIRRDMEILNQAKLELIRLSQRSHRTSDRLTEVITEFKDLGGFVLDTRMIVNDPGNGWLQHVESLNRTDFFGCAFDICSNNYSSVVELFFSRAMEDIVLNGITLGDQPPKYKTKTVDPMIPGLKDAADALRANAERRAHLSKTSSVSP